MYKVIHYFEDLQDFNHPYKVGDSFPRLGMNVSEKRLKELSGSNNKQGKPLIEEVKEVLEEKKYTKSEINRMSIAELKDVAGKIGVDNFDTMTGAELKKVLIKELGV